MRRTNDNRRSKELAVGKYNIDKDVACLKMCVEALEKQAISEKTIDKYRWHDLRKDPEDLPKDKYKIYLTVEEEISYPLTADGFWVCGEHKVTAWREIESFDC